MSATRRASTEAGSTVTWEPTGTEPNLSRPGEPHPIGNLYCFGCQHSATGVRKSAFDGHISACNH